MNNQNELILEHLREKPITPLEALRRYGSLRLGARIYELRRDGHNIITERVTKGRKTYAKYVLIGAAK